MCSPSGDIFDGSRTCSSSQAQHLLCVHRSGTQPQPTQDGVPKTRPAIKPSLSLLCPTLRPLKPDTAQPSRQETPQRRAPSTGRSRESYYEKKPPTSSRSSCSCGRGVRDFNRAQCHNLKRGKVMRYNKQWKHAYWRD